MNQRRIARMFTLASEATGDASPAESAAPVRSTWHRLDLVAPVVYLLGGVYLLGKLWLDLGQRLQADNIQDQGFFQFVLAHGARSVSHLSNPLFDAQINVPDGVNMMANTSVLGLSIPLAPVTMLFGPSVSFAVLAVLAPTLTATAWYYVLSRHVVRSRVAAFIGGGFCGFAPGFVSQSNGHPNVAGQFMVPLILLQVVRLKDTRRPVRTGLILGLLITYQAFVNEEVLLFTAIVGALMVLVFGLSRWEQLRAALRPGLIDLGTYFNYPTRSLGGAPSSRFGMRSHPAEENAFYGWPLLILALVITIWLWRRLLVRIAAVVALFFAAMSLGPHIVVYGHDTGIPGPF